MPQFLLLVSPERLPSMALAPTELGRRTQRFVDWVDALRLEKRVRSGGLLSTDSLRIPLDLHGISADAAPTPGASIRLYFVVEAESIEAAIAVAGRCPSALPGSVDLIEIEANLARSKAETLGAAPA